MNDNLYTLKPDELIESYRTELRRLRDDEIADKSEIHYGHGWYYISVATRAPDKSIGIWSMARVCRKKEVVELIENLRKREP